MVIPGRRAWEDFDVEATMPRCRWSGLVVAECRARGDCVDCAQNTTEPTIKEAPCSTCKGKGGDYYGPCWDCQGTGEELRPPPTVGPP